MTFTCSEIRIESESGRLIRATVENPRIEEILEHIDTEEIVRIIDTQELLIEIVKENILMTLDIEPLLRSIHPKRLIDYVIENIDSDILLDLPNAKAKGLSEIGIALQRDNYDTRRST